MNFLQKYIGNACWFTPSYIYDPSGVGEVVFLPHVKGRKSSALPKQISKSLKAMMFKTQCRIQEYVHHHIKDGPLLNTNNLQGKEVWNATNPFQVTDSPSPQPPGNASRSHHTGGTATTPTLRMHARADWCTAYGWRYLEVYQSGTWSSSSISDERLEKFKRWRADDRFLDFDARVSGWHTCPSENCPGGDKTPVDLKTQQTHQYWTQMIESNLLIKESPLKRWQFQVGGVWEFLKKTCSRQFEPRDS